MIYCFPEISLFVLFYFLFIISSHGNDIKIIKGKVVEEVSGEPLIGVNIRIKDKLIETITDTKGNFQLSTKTIPPFVIVSSIIGYESQEIEIDASDRFLEIELSEKIFVGQNIVISASRIEEQILSSPVSIEKMSILDIQQSSTTNFYDGLYQLKGVDMNANSLTFRFPNTRGFTGESNCRMNQLADGVENVSPELSFAAGNLFGLSGLDVESVELLVGASSALYDPGSMNGTLLMKSKSPFEYQELSLAMQTGIMHVNANYNQNPSPMFDVSLRYAKVFNDKIAFKITGGDI